MCCLCDSLYKRAERERHTPHNYESTPVDPLRHVGIKSSTEAPKLNNSGALSMALHMDVVGRVVGRLLKVFCTEDPAKRLRNCAVPYKSNDGTRNEVKASRV